jgi:hypothetical protein
MDVSGHSAESRFVHIMAPGVGLTYNRENNFYTTVFVFKKSLKIFFSKNH